jgi:hypothetical protein
MSTGLEQLSPPLRLSGISARTGIDWQRFGRRAFIVGAVLFGLIELYLQARGSEYGLDFHGGTWQAGRAVLEGRSPFPPPLVGSRLYHASSGFMTPPPLALIGIPFSLLPFGLATALFNMLCSVALIAALRVLGVTDYRVHLLALCSFPFVSSLTMGQPDGLFALAAALAWRHRDHRWKGALAAAVLIAAKLLAWPLVIWLLITRRVRQAWITAAGTVGILLGTWACIGFQGLAAYPRLLADDAKTYENQSHSIVAGLMHLGVPARASTAFAFLGAAGLAVTLARLGRGHRDVSCFIAATVLGIMSSAIVWEHYLVLLFVCFAALRRVHDRVFWLCVGALWIAPVENPMSLWQAWLVPVVVAAIVVRAGVLARRAARSSSTFVQVDLPQRPVVGPVSAAYGVGDV